MPYYNRLSKKARSAISNVNTTQWILALFIWSLCVQFLFNVFVVELDSNLSGDELGYNAIATNLVSQQQFVSDDGDPNWPQAKSLRPPVFPFYLALIYRGFGLGNYTAVKIGQSIIGALLCVVLFILAQRTFDKRTGLLAGFVASVYPYLVYYSSQLRPEPLYLLCVYSSAVLFIRFIETRRLVSGIIAGMCWGIAVLTHSDWLLTMPLFFIWGVLSLRKDRHGLLDLLPVFTIVFAIVLPWIWRNYLVHDAFVPVSTNLGVTIAGANNPAIVKDPILRGHWLPPEDIAQFVGDLSGLSEVERDKVQVQYALTFIQQNPMDFLTLGIWRLIRHWHFYYPATHDSLPELAALVFYFIVLFLATVGTIRLFMLRRMTGFVYFAFVLFIFTNTIAFVIRGGTRYRLLIDPSLITLASYAVTSILGTPLKRPRQRDSSQ